MNFDPRPPVVVTYGLLPRRLRHRGSGGAEQVRFPRQWEFVERPVLRLAGSRSTHQFVGQHSGAVNVSLLGWRPWPMLGRHPWPNLASDVTIGVASLADAGVASLADPAGSVAGRVTFLTDMVGVVTDVRTFLEGSGVRSGSVFVCENCDDDGPDCFDCDGPGGVDIDPDVTFLTELVGVASPDGAYQGTADVRNGSVYEYDDYDSGRPSCVDCAEPDGFDSSPGDVSARTG